MADAFICGTLHKLVGVSGSLSQVTSWTVSAEFHFVLPFEGTAFEIFN
jgi:hypothetical protein